MFQPLDWIINEYLPQLLDSFVNPQKRVSLGYLLIALLIAFCWNAWLMKAQSVKGLGKVWESLFAAKIWFSNSAVSDYKLMFINRAIMMLINPAMLSKLAVATFFYFLFLDVFKNTPAIFENWPVWTAPVLYTIFLFLFDDFSRFFIHRCLHRWPILWAFHKIHHTAETLTPFTVYRTHPVEGVIFSLRATFVQAISISLFVSLFGKNIDLVEIFGVNILLFIFNITGSNLRHSHVSIRYPRFLEFILISPAQHQVHHSIDPQHHDCNYGAAFAIWDYFGNSLQLSKESKNLRFGIIDKYKFNEHTLRGLYLNPFVEVRGILSRLF
tara:strand:+ start:2250 stop:3227 length:978 start_codon:yes stop_codon:yes gene_type:complete